MDTSPHKSGFANVNGIRLHYLDWGGEDQCILFLTGFGSSAHIYDRFAPRFSDKYHVLALTRRGHGDSDYPETGYDIDTLTEDIRLFLDSLKIDKVILTGHSMANVEICHFTALYPERVLKIVFLDSAYDRSSFAFTTMIEKNPLNQIHPPGINDVHYTTKDFIASRKKTSPPWAAIWGDLMDEEILHNIKKDTDGRVVERMPENIKKAFFETLTGYSSEDSKLKVPALSIFADLDGSDYLSAGYLTEEQKAPVIEFFNKIRPPYMKEFVEQFRRNVPHAKIIVIPKSHHYCFIKHEELVFDEMIGFLQS